MLEGSARPNAKRRLRWYLEIPSGRLLLTQKPMGQDVQARKDQIDFARARLPSSGAREALHSLRHVTPCGANRLPDIQCLLLGASPLDNDVAGQLDLTTEAASCHAFHLSCRQMTAEHCNRILNHPQSSLSSSTENEGSSCCAAP